MAEWSKALRSGRSSLRWAQVRILPCAMFFYPPISDLFIAHYKADRINQCASAGLFFSFIFTKMNSKNYRWMVKTEHILQKRVYWLWCEKHIYIIRQKFVKLTNVNCTPHLFFEQILANLLLFSRWWKQDKRKFKTIWMNTYRWKQTTLHFIRTKMAHETSKKCEKCGKEYSISAKT